MKRILLSLCPGMVAIVIASLASPQIALAQADPSRNLGEGGDTDESALARYLDLVGLQQGVADLDAGAIADAGLTLAEGERILRRRHPEYSPQSVLRLAIEVAVQTQDSETLARLVRYAEQTRNDQLSKQIDAAKALSSDSRSALPFPKDDPRRQIDDATYHRLMRQIVRLGLRCDTAGLIKLRESLRSSKEPTHHRAMLLLRISNALISINQEREASKDTDPKGDQVPELLKKLEAESRGSVQITFYNRTPYDIWIATAKYYPPSSIMSSDGGSTHFTPGLIESRGWWKANRYGGSCTVPFCQYIYVVGSGGRKLQGFVGGDLAFPMNPSESWHTRLRASYDYQKVKKAASLGGMEMQHFGKVSRFGRVSDYRNSSVELTLGNLGW